VINDKDEEIELLSSVECKGIVGNDSRHYVLDLLRTFPPDLNFLPIEDEDLNEGSKALGFPRKHRHKLVCLRQEPGDAFDEKRYVTFVKHAAFQLQQLRLQKMTEEKNKMEKEKEKMDQEKESAASGEDASIESQREEEIETEEAKKMVSELTTDSNDNKDEDASREIVRKAAQAVGSISDTEFNVAFNPDVYQPLIQHTDEEGDTLAHEKKLVKDAAEFLLIHQIPNLIRGCMEHTSSPFDGYTLSEAFHHKQSACVSWFHGSPSTCSSRHSRG